MEQIATNVLSDHDIEITSPERDEDHARDAAICLCCQKKRSASRMDADGCGICDECLAP